MKLIADTHTHTLASGHAYSTITENLRYAADLGLRFLACTDHTGSMPEAPHLFYFINLKILPDALFGVHLLRGCEVNVLDAAGTLDLPDENLEGLEWVIASMHPPTSHFDGLDAVTNAWLRIAENPHVDVIGHCGDPRFSFDQERVVRAFKEHGKIVEINANSFSARKGSEGNCRDVAFLCKKHEVRVVVNSDAHFYTHIGACDPAIRLLEEIDFPSELVINADLERFSAVASEKSGRTFASL